MGNPSTGEVSFKLVNRDSQRGHPVEPNQAAPVKVENIGPTGVPEIKHEKLEVKSWPRQ